jgi:lysozyme
MLPSNITKNKYIACLSLAWNIGLGAFAASTLLKHLKINDYGSAAEDFLSWNKETIKGKKVFNKGLHERRKREQALFLKG